MMSVPVHCLMVSGLSLTDSNRSTLFDAAQQMVRNGQTRRKIKGPDFEGIVTTNGEVALMGSVAGYVFHAEIEGEKHHCKASYLIAPPTCVPKTDTGTPGTASPSSIRTTTEPQTRKSENSKLVWGFHLLFQNIDRII